MKRNTNPRVNPMALWLPLKKVHVGARCELSASNIVMIESDISYSHIHLRNGEKLTVAMNIQKLQERFAHVWGMVRVHRRYLVNLCYLKSVVDFEIRMENGLKATVSRRKFDELASMLCL